MPARTSIGAMHTSLGRRAIAGATDLIAYLALQVAWSLCVAIGGEDLDTTTAAATVFTIIGYGVPLLAWSCFASNVPTPGERLGGVRVAHRDGSRPTFWPSMLRTATFIGGVACLLLGPGMILLTKSKRGFHDILTGTIVTTVWPLGHCANCGYNLRGNVARACPECGLPTDCA